MAVLFAFLKLPAPKGKLSEKLKRVDYAGIFFDIHFSGLHD
jgi:hypothetical protein